MSIFIASASQIPAEAIAVTRNGADDNTAYMKRAMGMVKQGNTVVIELADTHVVITPGDQTLKNLVALEKHLSEHARFLRMHTSLGKGEAILKESALQDAQYAGLYTKWTSLEEDAKKDPEAVMAWLKKYVASDVYREAPIQMTEIASRLANVNGIGDDNEAARIVSAIARQSWSTADKKIPADLEHKITSHQHSIAYYEASEASVNFLQGLCALARSNGLEAYIPAHVIRNPMDGPVETHYLGAKHLRSIKQEYTLSAEIYDDAVIVFANKQLDTGIRDLTSQRGFSIKDNINEGTVITFPAGTSREQGLNKLADIFNSEAISKTADGPNAAAINGDTLVVTSSAARGPATARI